MFSIIGIVVVFGAVVAGYLMEHGNLRVLLQPSELIIILGAAIGTVLVANPLHILTKIGGGIGELADTRLHCGGDLAGYGGRFHSRV